jgi:hypothetical protein
MEQTLEHVIEYIVDGEPERTNERVLTPTQILRHAKIDPSTHYLIQIEGEHQESYQGKPETPIHMHPHMNFISVSTGPTPVS